jgi:hypothetical protein
MEEKDLSRNENQDRDVQCDESKATSELKASQRLPAMQAANLPHLDWRTMVSGEIDKLSAEDLAALDGYFHGFIQLDFNAEERKCPCCQSTFGKNGLVSFLMAGAPGHATLEWGLVHGEAFCSRCKYPYRVYHRDIGPIQFLNVGLPYHPDELKANAPAN